MSEQNKQIHNVKTKIYVGLYTVIFLVALVVIALTSRRWSAYTFVLSDPRENLLLIGESSEEKDCHRRARKKIDEGVRMTRFETANSYFCGKYCFETPLVAQLQRADVFCMLKREASESSSGP